MSSSTHTARTPRLTRLVAATAAVVTAAGFALAATALPAAASGPTTAWDGSHFQVDTQGALSRSDIVLGSAPTQDTQSMPLGNGTLGVAAWDADGFTAQLNRVDTMPDRKSPGQLVIPGLADLTGAPDYSGRLSLYNATLTQTGDGMTATTFVPANKDELVVDVHGADPSKPQTATLHLWDGRTPTITAENGIGILSDTWQDTRGAGATGETFGTLAAVTASGRDVTATKIDNETVQLSFTPNADGSFRVVVAAPHWAGGNATATAASALGSDATAPLADLTAPHLKWWHDFWAHTDVIEMDSADGSAQYVENLRNIALYSAASEERSSIPGTQAGVADLFSYSEDSHQWDPSAYWHWNIRAQTAALLGAGDAALTDPYFNLYRNDLPAIQAWTAQHMPGNEGICVPETMRFSGQGYENETWLSSPGLNCDDSPGGYYNKRTITTGAEIGLNVWLRYQLTGDESFLKANYPLMAQPAQFLASYAKVGADGKLHTYPSNAHETQWDVHDPTTDIAAMKSLFPAVIAAAQHLNTDSGLVATLKADLDKIMPFNTTGTGSNQVIADSYDPNAPIKNSENIGLEPVWPYGVIGDNSGAATALAINTYNNRPNKYVNDWSFDAVQAARLGLRDQTKDALVQLTEKYQVFPSGLGNLYGTVGKEAYIEQAAAAALGVQEALVPSYDGTVQFAPAVPSDWSVSGSAQVSGGTAHVQTVGGAVSTAVIDASGNTTLKIQNPWQGQQVHVLAVANGASHEVVAPTSADTFSLAMTRGTSYVIERTASPTASQTFAPVSGTPATAVKTLGSRTIGIAGPGAPLASLTAGFDNVGITDDAHTNGGNIDGGGSASMSLQALAAVGAKSGGTVSYGGLDFAWPASGSLKPDNLISAGQTILVGKAAKRVGFLLTGTYAPTGGEISGDAIVHYSDGTIQRLTLHAADWSADPLPGTDVALQPAYENRANNTQYQHPAHVYYLSFDLDAAKTVTSITVPRISAATPATVPMLHIFSMAFEDAPATNPGGSGSGGTGTGGGSTGSGGTGSGSSGGSSGGGSTSPGGNSGAGNPGTGTGTGSNPAAPGGTTGTGSHNTANSAEHSGLANTGSNLLLPAGLGVLLLALGAVGILVIRRRAAR